MNAWLVMLGAVLALKAAWLEAAAVVVLEEQAPRAEQIKAATKAMPRARRMKLWAGVALAVAEEWTATSRTSP